MVGSGMPRYVLNCAYKQHYSNAICLTSLEYIELLQFTLFHTSSVKFMFQNTMKYVHNQKNADKNLSTSVKLDVQLVLSYVSRLIHLNIK
jgi:hypothetical protein